jgi:nickel/cobalt transporter (NicO) family protein
MRYFLFLLSFVFASPHARAHPHVLVDSAVEITFNAQKQVISLTHIWAFDEFYSAFVVQDMVGRKAENQTPSPQKLHEFALSSVANLGDMSFFTSLKIGKITPAFERKDEPSMVYEKNKLVLRFTLILKEPLALAGEKLALQVVDPEFVVAFLPAAGEIVTYKNPPEGCKADYDAPKSSVTDARNLGESFFAQGLGANVKNFVGGINVICP